MTVSIFWMYFSALLYIFGAALMRAFIGVIQERKRAFDISYISALFAVTFWPIVILFAASLGKKR